MKNIILKYIFHYYNYIIKNNIILPYTKYNLGMISIIGRNDNFVLKLRFKSNK